MLKRPASSHTLRAAILKRPAMERKCWSCIAGGFLKWSSAAQSNLDQRGCCGSCASNRTCMCGAFNEDRSAIWCTGCHQHLAKWCRKCETPGDLDSQLCGRCRDRGVTGKADSTEKGSARLDGVCWSCVDGGFGAHSQKAQKAKSFKGCCCSCSSHRSCPARHTFHEALAVAWCTECCMFPAL